MVVIQKIVTEMIAIAMIAIVMIATWKIAIEIGTTGSTTRTDTMILPTDILGHGMATVQRGREAAEETILDLRTVALAVATITTRRTVRDVAVMTSTTIDMRGTDGVEVESGSARRRANESGRRVDLRIDSQSKNEQRGTKCGTICLK